MPSRTAAGGVGGGDASRPRRREGNHTSLRVGTWFHPVAAAAHSPMGNKTRIAEALRAPTQYTPLQRHPMLPCLAAADLDPVDDATLAWCRAALAEAAGLEAATRSDWQAWKAAAPALAGVTWPRGRLRPPRLSGERVRRGPGGVCGLHHGLDLGADLQGRRLGTDSGGGAGRAERSCRTPQGRP
jgi:hypothetical protein